MDLFYFSKKKLKYFPMIFLENENKLSITEKMKELSRVLEITPEEYITRRSVCADVREILRKYYPDCLVLAYGSSVSGLAFKNCGVDLLFLPFPGYSNLEANTKVVKPDIIPQPADIISGGADRSLLTKLDGMSHLKFIKAAFISEKSKLIRYVRGTSRTRFVKIFVRNQRILCELSATNIFVVYNSELLQFLVQLDPRVKPLIMTLKFWAKSLSINKRVFSSYAFTMLVVFFLQTRNPPILPSVKKLMDLSHFSRMIAGWQTAFTTDVNVIPRSGNTENMGDLLYSFFAFYCNFNFVENIISLYSGRVLTIQDLKEDKDERLAAFDVKAFNIQDPFILSQNVCRNECHTTMFRFLLYLARQILNDTGNFKNLFNPFLYQKVFNTQYKEILTEENPKLITLCLENDLKLKVKGNDFKQWYDFASECVFDILKYVFLTESEIVDKIDWNKKTYKTVDLENVSNKTNSETSTKVCSLPDLELLIAIQCMVYSRTWVGRKNINEALSEKNDKNEFSNSVLESEHRISRALIEKNPLLNKPTPFLCFRCECYRYGCAQISDVVLVLKPLTPSKEFQHLSNYLASYIPKTVKKILRETDL